MTSRRQAHLPIPRSLTPLSEDDQTRIKFLLEDLGESLRKVVKRANPAAKIWNQFIGNKGTRLIMQWKTHSAWSTPDSQIVAQAYPMADGTVEIRVEYNYMFETDGWDRSCRAVWDPMGTVRPETLIYKLAREVQSWDLVMHRTGGLMTSPQGVRVAQNLGAYLATEGTGNAALAARAREAFSRGPLLSIRQVWRGPRP